MRSEWYRLKIEWPNVDHFLGILRDHSLIMALGGWQIRVGTEIFGLLGCGGPKFLGLLIGEDWFFFLTIDDPDFFT